MLRRATRVVIVTSACALVLSSALSAAHAQAPSATAAGGGEATFQPRRIARIAPGTRIVVDRPPEGWSALVMKSQPQVTEGDINRIPSMTIQLAGMLFSVLTASAAQEPNTNPPQYFLSGVGTGLGMNVGGADTIVSSATASQQGLNLGMISSMVLSTSETRLDEIVEVARSKTMAVVDAPTMMAKGETHVPVVFRYAFLCDPRDARLYTVVWVVDHNTPGGSHVWDGTMRLLPQPCVENCTMRVDANQFAMFGQPKPTAFAVTRMPAGTVLRPSPELLAAAAQRAFTPSLAHQLEVGLWQAVFDPALTAQRPQQTNEQ